MSVASPRSCFVKHSKGSSPPSYAATRHRSIRRGTGSGSATDMTTTSCPAFATTIRSIGSVSSAVRRSTEERSPTRTILASASTAPLTSPTTSTSSPTTTEVRRMGPARIATTSRSSTRQVNLPRSTATTRPGTALACFGCSRVRRRDGPGRRIRMSSSSSPRGLNPAAQARANGQRSRASSCSYRRYRRPRRQAQRARALLRSSRACGRRRSPSGHRVTVAA